MAFLNRCIFTPTAGGVADFTLLAALPGYMTPVQAGAVNGSTYHYVAESNDKQTWEIGTGTWNSGVLARTTVLWSSAGGTKIAFQGIPTVAIDAVAEDFVNSVWTNVRIGKTGAYSVANGDKGATIALGGNAFYALNFNAASGFDANFAVMVVNEDAVPSLSGRAKWIQISGGQSFYLWPGQCANVFNSNGVWQYLRPPRYKLPANSPNVTFFSDFTNGTDTYGVTDGLAPGVPAFKSAEHAFIFAADQLDFNAAVQTQVTCQMAAGTVDTTGIHAPVHGLVGAQGGAAFGIVGASLTVTGAANNGSGLVRLTVSSTATYSNNQIVSVYGVGGTTEANGTWKVTVSGSTTLDLQSSSFVNPFTSAGTVTNGSSIVTSGVDGLAFYFGSVMQIKNITVASNQNGINALWGSKIYILDGVIFAGSPAGAHINIQMNSHVEVDAPYGIATAAPFHILANDGASIGSGGSAVINFLAGVNPAFSAAFVYGVNGGRVLTSGWTINTNGNTVTGKRWQADNLGLVVSASGAPNTFFPGSVSGTTSGGGQGV